MYKKTEYFGKRKSFSLLPKSGKTMSSATWNFGDGSTNITTSGGDGKEYNTIHNYPAFLSYPLIVNIVYTDGTTCKVNMDVEMRERCKVKIEATPDNPYLPDPTITFKAKTTAGTVNNWDWDFGDGGTDNFQTVTHSYVGSGNKSVNVKVYYKNPLNGNQNEVQCQDSYVAKIQSAPPPCKIDIVPSPTGAVDNGATVAFSVQVDGCCGTPTSYSWTLPSGGQAGLTASDVFNSSYSVKVTATAPGGTCTDNHYVSVKGQAPPCNISLVTSPADGSVRTGVNIKYETKNLGITPPSSYSWEVDGSPVSGSNSVKFKSFLPGSHTVKVTGTTSTGTCVAVSTKNIYYCKVGISLNPTTDFEPSQVITYNGDKLEGLPKKYKWDFGDGTSANTQNTSHSYTSGGVKYIKLTASSLDDAYSCYATTKITVKLPPPPCVQTANVRGNCEMVSKCGGNINSQHWWGIETCTDEPFKGSAFSLFQNKANHKIELQNTTYKWTIPDANGNKFYSTQNPTHNFLDVAGNFEVELITRSNYKITETVITPCPTESGVCKEKRWTKKKNCTPPEGNPNACDSSYYVEVSCLKYASPCSGVVADDPGKVYEKDKFRYPSCTGTTTRCFPVLAPTPELYYNGWGHPNGFTDPGTCSFTVKDKSWDPLVKNPDVVSCGDYTLINDYNNSSSLEGVSFPVNPDGYSIKWEVQNQFGNRDEYTDWFVVLDDIDPIIYTKGSIPDVNINANGDDYYIALEDFYSHATDNCIEIKDAWLNQYQFGCADVDPNKQSTVTAYAKDKWDNVGNKSDYIWVRDLIPPTVITKDITVELDINGQYTIIPEDIDNGSYDNCTMHKTLSRYSYNCDDVGSNTVYLKIKDNDINETSQSAIITVIDVRPPDMFTKDIKVYLDINGDVSIFPSDIDNGTFDNCEMAYLTFNDYEVRMDFGCEHCGENYVTLYGEDIYGNKANQTCIVEVIDTIPPVALCKSVTITIPNIGEIEGGSITVPDTFIDNGSYDPNCFITQYSMSKTYFDCTDKGDNQVTLLVTDPYKNYHQCFANVKVIGKTPVISSQPKTVDICEKTQNMLAIGINESGDVIYQWYKNGKAVKDMNTTGAKENVLKIDNAKIINSGTYYCVATEACPTKSYEVGVHVRPGVNLTSQPQNIAMDIDLEDKVIYVATKNVKTYQWLLNGVEINGANGSHYIIKPEKESAGKYKCYMLTKDNCEKYSEEAVIIILD